MYNISILYICIYILYILYISNNLQFNFSFVGLYYIWATDTIITVFQICTEILPSAIVLTSQAWSALIDPQAIFPGTD